MISCAVTTSLLGCMVTLYLYFRYTMCLDIGLLPRIFLLMPFLAAGCIPLLVSYRLENLLGSFYTLYRHSLYFIFIGCIILFTVTLISDALFLLFSLFPSAAKFGFCCRWLNWTNLALALLCTIWALYSGFKIPEVREINITDNKLKHEYTIAVLSDLHIHRVVSPRRIEKIVEQTNARKPDVVLLAGDVIDDDTGRITEAVEKLKGLKAEKGVYFVTGNHEFYTGYARAVRELKNLGFSFLENAGAPLGEDLYLAGVPDTFSGAAYGKMPDLKAAFAGAGKEAFRLLVSHTPAVFPRKDFDLEVSGHTHGGQIFPFHILTKLHNKYLSGLYEMENGARIYVSDGAGQWGPQMRFLAPSEITILKIGPSIKKAKE